MATYEYEPLDETASQIRILTLLPSSGGPELRGRLRAVNLDSKVEYETLSYVWGDNLTFDHALHIGNSLLRITGHLADILQHIRLPDAERDLWIDAICINQADEAGEKGCQVQMMRDIYRNAKVDLAWLGNPPNALGEEEPTGHEGVEETEEEWREKLGERFTAFEAWLRYLRDEQDRESDSDQDDGKDEPPGQKAEVEPSDGTIDSSDGSSDEEWGYYSLFKEEYRNYSPVTVDQGLNFIKSVSRHDITLGDFHGHGVLPGIRARMEVVCGTRLWSRIWIVQELSCAKDVLLLGDKESMRWKTLSKFLARAHNSDVHHFPWARGIIEGGLAKTFFRAAEIDKQRDIVKSGQEESTLLDVLARFCDRESSNPRDRVYGLLGLIARPHHLGVDYTISSAKLFINATVEIIRECQNLDILCQSPWERRGIPQCSRHGPRTEGLPSWAVDFGAKALSWNAGESFRTREIMFAGSKTRKIYSAGLAPPAQIADKEEAAGKEFCEESWGVLDGKVLQLHGYLLGQIGPQQLQPPVDIEDIKPGTWGPELADGEYPATGEPKRQALWRTLLTDCSGYPMRRLEHDDIERLDGMFCEIQTGGRRNNYDLYWKVKRIWERIEHNWGFYVGGDGLFIMARRHVQEGDYIAVIEGAKVPLILESVDKDSESQRFKIVSPAYVHGYMDGEAFTQHKNGALQRTDLLLL